MEPNWSLERVRKKKGKKLGVLPNTHSEREEALFVKSSKTPKSPALVFLACLFCILFCVVGLLRELGRQVGSLARSLSVFVHPTADQKGKSSLNPAVSHPSCVESWQC